MYQVLARKYRPRNFNELVGQNHVSRALTSALERGRLHHAYLFTGTRGVGKTTIARILAKCLNCETGVTATPCEQCATCTAVNEGRFIDLIEIDAASRTKVEDTRELLDNVPYAPTQGRFKVYLIDEVHMLSTHSFNALLKTLEEPPEHVKFLFATTDPQKLPITVISRCLQFTLRPLAVDEITEHLSQILQREQIQAETDAIWQIAESAQGSLRDALSLTDQAIAYGQGQIQHRDVKDMLGLIDRTIIFDLILAIHQNQREKVSQLLLQFRQQALDVSLVLDQLISTLHELALLQYLPNLSLKYSSEINKKIMQLSQLISAQDLQLYYQIACKGRADLQLAVTQEQGFEMCVLRLLAFKPLQANEILQHQDTRTQAVAQQLGQQQLQAVGLDGQDQPDQKKFNTQIIQSIPPHMPQPEDGGEHQSSHNPQPQPVAGVQVEHKAQAASVMPPSASQDEEDTDLILFQQMMESDQDQPSISSDERDVQANLHHDGTSEQDLSEVNAAEVALDSFQDLDREPVTESSETLTTDNIAPAETQLATAEPEALELTAFGSDVIHPEEVVPTSQQDDIFFLAPEAGIQSEIAAPAVQTGSTVPALQPDQVVQAEPVAASVTITSSASNITLMPQDILKLPEVELSGEWDIHKWEFWFRQSDLPPAFQELAQQGLMQGNINGASTFVIPENYESLLHSLLPTLEAALKKQWPQTQLQVKYAQPGGQTPYSLQHERKEKAFQRAHELLQQEPVVEKLMNTFGGQLTNIQLKP